MDTEWENRVWAAALRPSARDVAVLMGARK